VSITFLVRSLNLGGAQRQLVALAKALYANGASVLVVAFYGGGPLLRELEDAGVPVAILEKRGRLDVVGFVGRLWRVLRCERPQVIYAFLVEPSVLALLMKPLLHGTRVVWGVRASNVDFSRYDWLPRFTFGLSRALARFADLIIANSWAGAEYHRSRGYPRAKVTVVPNGIDLVRFRPDAEGGRRMRAVWGISEQDSVVGIVGRLDPMKDHSTFLEAAGSLRLEQLDVRFVCVGDGSPAYRLELQRRAAVLGLADRVTWAGAQQDMTAVYNAFDVCCLSSAFGEGFSNVLGEAMACGIPCVATDVGDAAWILGTLGTLVPPGDPARLADAIREGLSRAGAEQSRACRERIERQFSLDRMVAETERLLRACVDASA